jgi:hypothetical protein
MMSTFTAATIEVDVMPFISRSNYGGPFESYYNLLSNLSAEFVRFAPWCKLIERVSLKLFHTPSARARYRCVCPYVAVR